MFVHNQEVGYRIAGGTIAILLEIKKLDVFRYRSVGMEISNKDIEILLGCQV